MQYKLPGVPKGLDLPFERVQEEGSLLHIHSKQIIMF